MFQSMRSILFTAFSAIVLLSMAEVAEAASDICRIVPFEQSCETNSVAANPSGHFIFFEVSPNTTYRVFDNTTKVVVASGTAGWLGHRQTIFGLYGNNYTLKATNQIGGFGYINNN